ncbi:MAG: substrate-binding domain-containing protein, partial [Oscillospiraceae bacterium]
IVLSAVAASMAALMLASCGAPAATGGAAFDTTAQVTVVSREANSGTRSAFDEMMKIVIKDGDKTTDKLFPEAIIVDSTDAVASKVEVDPAAIGYTSLGSVTDRVHAVQLDGVDATVANVINKSYKLSRPFLLATMGKGSPLAEDFIKYIMSADGQKIVEGTNLIKSPDASGAAYSSSGLAGKLTLSGSTSVEKVMEKLREEYLKLNPKAEVEITYSGSSAGIKDALAEKVDIAMSSRALTADESAKLTAHDFAIDAIAVIVNPENSVKALKSEQVTAIFTGAARTWADAEK